MRILFIGDIVGDVGRKMLQKHLPSLQKRWDPHFIIINGENAAGGRGITKKIADNFFQWGVHAITLGNHTWDQKEVQDWMDTESRVIRPANFPPGIPGFGQTYIRSDSKILLGIISFQGRTFMTPLDCPFRIGEEIIGVMRSKTPYIFIDFHAEATSEKQAMGWFMDGRATAVVGTHTHVQTNDSRILPKGTAYLTDAGMTGSFDGILGMDREEGLRRFLTAMPTRLEVKKGRGLLSGVVIDVDEVTGLSKKIETIFIIDEDV